MKAKIFLLIIPFIIGMQNIKAQDTIKQGAIVTGNLDSSKWCDTLRLILSESEYKDFLPYPIKPLAYYTVPVINGKFTFRLPDSLEYPVHFMIDSNMQLSMAKRSAYLFDYILDRGDSVHIKISRDKLHFSGRGAEKLICRHVIDSINNSESSRNLGMYMTATSSALTDLYKDSVLDVATYTKMRFEKNAGALETRLKTLLTKLEEFRHILPEHIYQLMYIDLITSKQNVFFQRFLQIKHISDSNDLNRLKALFDRFPMPADTIPEEIRLKSPYYLTYLWQKELRDFYFKNRKTDYSEMYYAMRGKYPKKVNERLLTFHIRLINRVLVDNSELISDALGTQVKTEGYRNLLEYLGNANVSTEAFNFALPDLNGNIVKLSDFEGKVVFLDFYYRGCSACKLYYQNIVSKVKKSYIDNPDVVFVAISIDKTRKDWLAGIESEEYSSHHAVNLNTEGLGYHHLAVKNYGVIGYPTPILIDKRGYIFNRKRGDLRSSVEGLKQQIEMALAN